MRASIRRALSTKLNQRFERRDWFADSPSRKRVREHEHFDYLMLSYLPDHRGAMYCNESDLLHAQQRDTERAVSVIKK